MDQEQGGRDTSRRDPVETDPEHCAVVFEDERVRVLEHRDQPGDRTSSHEHPGSVMWTLTAFHRRLHLGEVQRDVELPAGCAGWVPAQAHAGENTGQTPTHAIFVELKEPAPGAAGGGAATSAPLGPQDPAAGAGRTSAGPTG